MTLEGQLKDKMTDSPPTGLAEPEVGSYFVATYPPFSVWSPEAVERDARPALRRRRRRATPLGLYLHIPFCRKRCHFCYFRVYTDKNAQEIGQLSRRLGARVGAVRRAAGDRRTAAELRLFRRRHAVLSLDHAAAGLVDRLNAVTPWDQAEEITFECEPGTLTSRSSTAIRKMGVTRLSLGVENFDDRILEINGRAHRSPEIETAYSFARALGFPQINIDLIAGMLGETEENWQRNIEKTVELEPDSVTIYQMELPYNTTISKDLLQKTGQMTGTGRRLGYQAALGAAGVRGARERRLSHRQRLHRGQGSRRRRSSSTAIASGRAPTWPASASPRSATSTASTCRTRTRGRPTARRSTAASCRSAAPTGRRRTSGCAASWCCS